MHDSVREQRVSDRNINDIAFVYVNLDERRRSRKREHERPTPKDLIRNGTRIDQVTEWPGFPARTPDSSQPPPEVSQRNVAKPPEEEEFRWILDDSPPRRFVECDEF